MRWLYLCATRIRKKAEQSHHSNIPIHACGKPPPDRHLPIGYDELTDTVDRDTGQTVKLAVPVAVLAELLDEDAV